MQREPTPPPPGSPPGAIVLSFPVPRELAGMRLDRFVQHCIPRLSRTRAQAIVKACARRPDGSSRRPSEKVRANETVLIVRPPFEEPPTPQTFGVLHEDEAMVVVDKPAGLPVHPSATYHKNTLTYLMRGRYPERTPHLTHRLDRETSGVVVCARTIEDERILKRAFEDRQVSKTYLAIVHGHPEKDTGMIDSPMGRVSEGLHLLMEVRADGNPAQTRFEVLARAPEHALLRLHPRTGRQHQLRVHTAALGHPIMGDKLYGPHGPQAFIDYIDGGMTEELASRLGHERQALHAYELEIVHPRSNEPITLRAPFAADLMELWERLGGPALSLT